MSKQHYRYPLVTDDWSIDTLVTVNWHQDGIGSYEFWGAKGYDAGEWVSEVTEVEPLFRDESEDRCKEIEDYITAHWEEIVEDFQKKEEFYE